ncbi:MAG TPA: M56 family metallopeptidase [Granulicella sp.]|jgi:uncharacterized protein (TIGR03435 family)
MMMQSLTSIVPGVANHLWQSTVFVAAVWLGTLLLRRNAARVRFSLWLAASIKFLIPFSLLVGLGGLLPRQQHVEDQRPTIVYSTVNAMGQPFADFKVLAADSPAHRMGLLERVKADAPVLLAMIWLCGAIAVLMVWGVRLRQMQRQLRRAVPAGAGREFEILRRVSDGRRVRLLLSRDLMEPGIFKVFRPVLIWPEQLSARLDDGHIEAIVAHELMHVRRRDNLSALLHMLVEAAFWFHPMVWWMERRLVEERERACDEAVVERGGDAATYAESLLKACRFCVESPLVCVSGITGADLSKRVRSIMTLRLERMGPMMKSVLVLLMLITVAGPVAFGAHYAELRAQQAVAEDWQKAAGGKMQFEVASVRLNPGPFETPSFPLSSDDSYWNTGGLFHADFPISVYIDFAYKLQMNTAQLSQLPKWVSEDRYEIHARTAGTNPTKDQIRLMMQTLLKERFGLVVHFETQETSVLEMTLVKPGTLGPKLHRHEDGPPCKEVEGPLRGQLKNDDEPFPSVCNAYVLTPGQNNMVKMGSRNTTLQLVANAFSTGSNLGRQVVDATGLTGRYDFTLEWTPSPGDVGQAPRSTILGAPTSDPQGPTFLEAMQEELGLKLKPGKTLIKVLVADHAERPSEN